jgi:hypothetical protein
MKLMSPASVGSYLVETTPPAIFRHPTRGNPVSPSTLHLVRGSPRGITGQRVVRLTE